VLSISSEANKGQVKESLQQDITEEELSLEDNESELEQVS
jgi:hypothetical protein